MQLKNPVAINVWLRFAIRHTNSNFCYIEWAICNKLTKKREMERIIYANNRLYQQIWIMQKLYLVRYN